jgi:hypothetical protein
VVAMGVELPQVFGYVVCLGVAVPRADRGAGFGRGVVAA